MSRGWFGFLLPDGSDPTDDDMSSEMTMARQHLHVLDGLRGVAAFAVVAFHFGSRADLPYLMPRGYLAVDFFFALSGFVVAHAYLSRLPAMSAGGFAARRFVRLWPMLLPGTILGAAIEFWRPNAGEPIAHAMSVVLATVLGCFALPLPVSTVMEQTIFPINGPIWSLFFEAVANGLFFVAGRSGRIRSVAWILAIAGAVGVCSYSVADGSVDAGFLLTDWVKGFPRVALSFSAGVLVFLYAGRFRAMDARLAIAALVAVIMVPRFAGPLDPLFDLAAILLVFPVIVGCASHSGTQHVSAGVCDWLGQLSYPLYAFHYPLVRAICFIVNHHQTSVPVRVAAAVATVLLAAGLSWLLLAFYDRPIRRVLTRRLLSDTRATQHRTELA